jgi:hypothetical protein
MNKRKSSKKNRKGRENRKMMRMKGDH